MFAKWDAIWTEGQGFDQAWNTVWQSRGQITDRGYVVWMSIPFKSLRFDPATDQLWGLVLNREIPRNNENTFWPRVSSRRYTKARKSTVGPSSNARSSSCW